MTKLICKNSQLFFPAVCWLCAYPAAFQWLLLRFDLILHPLVAEKNASHDQLYSKTDFIAIGWDSLSLTISIGSSISWPHDQFDGFLSRLLPPTYTSRINRGLWRCNRHVKIDIFWEKHPMKALSLNSQILLHLYLILENRDVLFENRTCETVDHGLIWNLHSRRFNSWDCLQNVNFLDDVCCLHIIVYPWNHKL